MTKINILFDLKPALDGYAGIPQETRLLFAGLLSKNTLFNVEGLLQHAGISLSAGLNITDTHLKVYDRLVRLSNSVISFYGSSKKGFIAANIKKINNFILLKKLCWQVLQNKELQMGVFDGGAFDDFIWTRLFNKTLKAEHRLLVTKANHRILAVSRKMLHEVGLTSLSRFIKPQYLKINTDGYDYFIAQTPFPGRVSVGTQLIIRYHDAVPVLMPHTIGDKGFHQASHYHALKDNVESGALFSCISEATRNDLLKLFPEVAERALVIPNIVSDAYFYDETVERSQVLKILHIRRNLYKENTNYSIENLLDHKDIKYLLMVSTLEPRKNHQLLLQAWEKLKYRNDYADLKLVIVGNLGWEYEPILETFKPWLIQGELYHLSNVPVSELRVLYQYASATICPSIAEGFDYSGIEAMCCKSLVLASDIPVHKEIYGEAALYFDAYDVDQTVEKICYALSIETKGTILALKQHAAVYAEKYQQENILPLWFNWLTTIQIKYINQPTNRDVIV